MGTKALRVPFGMKIMFLRAFFYIFLCMFSGERRLKSKIRDEKDPLPPIGPKRIR